MQMCQLLCLAMSIIPFWDQKLLSKNVTFSLAWKASHPRLVLAVGSKTEEEAIEKEDRKETEVPEKTEIMIFSTTALIKEQLKD